MKFIPKVAALLGIAFAVMATGYAATAVLYSFDYVAEDATDPTSTESGLSIDESNVAHVTSSDGWLELATSIASSKLTPASISIDADITFTDIEAASITRFDLDVPLDGNGYAFYDFPTTLFPTITSNGSVKNLCVYRSRYYYNDDRKVDLSYDFAAVGGVIAGTNNGTIEYCVVLTKASIDLNSVIQFHESGDAYDINYGGLVGKNTGSIKNTYSNCQIVDKYWAPAGEPLTLVLPQKINVAGIVGHNDGGTVQNIFCDYVRERNGDFDYSEAGNVTKLVAEASITIPLTDSVTGNITCNFAEGVALKSDGTVDAIYCPYGAVTDGTWSFYKDETCPIVRPSFEFQGGTVELVLNNDTGEGNATMTPLDARIPTRKQIPFSNSDEWTFDYSYYNIDTINNGPQRYYRAPIPAMGKTVDLGSLSVSNSEVSVTSVDDWNRVSDAIDAYGVTSVKLDVDISDASALFPIRAFDDVTLDGGGHTVKVTGLPMDSKDYEQWSLIENIGTNGVVQNLRITTELDTVFNYFSPIYGFLTRVNNGTIKSCVVQGSLYNSLRNIISQKGSTDIALGVLAGINAKTGTVENITANVNLILKGSNVASAPQTLYAGGLVGLNHGIIKDAVLCNVVQQSEGSSVTATAPLTLSNCSTINFESGNPPTDCSFGCLTGYNDGTIERVYGNKGILSSIPSADYSYMAGKITFSAYSYNTDYSGGDTVFAQFDDASVITEFDKEWVLGSDIKKLFENPEEWGFTHYTSDKTYFVYRTPNPVTFTSEPPTYLYSLNINEEGVSLVSSADDWNNTTYALDDAVGGISGVKLLSDLQGDALSPFYDLYVPLDGAGHTISKPTTQLANTISQSGSIRNLNVQDAKITVATAKFGGLATYNYGNIESVNFNASLSVDLPTSFQSGDVAIGGLVAENYGTVSATSIQTFISSSTSEAQEVTLSTPINSVYFANLAAVNAQDASISDCFISQSTSTDSYELIDLSAQAAFTYESEVEPSLSIAALTAINNGSVSNILCSPSMFLKHLEKWYPTLGISFTNSVGSYSFESSDWNSTMDMTIQHAKSDESVETDWVVDANILSFSLPSLWSFNCPPDPNSAGETIKYRFPVPNMLPRIVESEAKPESELLSLSVADTADVKGVFDLLSDINSALFRVAKVDFSDNISYDYNDLDFESLTADKIAETMDELPLIPNFGGVLNGSTVSNLQAQMSGLFGSVDEDAQVNNLVFDNVAFYVDPTDPKYIRSNDTIYVDLLTKELYGEMNNVGVSGVVIVDDTKLSQLGTDTTIVIVLIGENGADAVLTGFVFLDDAQTPAGNKKMIPMKQNLCTGKIQKSKRKKVALRKDGGNKDLGISFNPDEKRFKQDECLFSVDEFASGLVAYWLNFDGPGFTGNYTGHWSQGERVPISSPSTLKALYPVNIESNDPTLIEEAPKFANGGSQITLKFTSEPESIKSGNRLVSFSGTEATVLFTGGELITVTFPETSTLPETDAPELTLSVSGNSVSISGATGLTKDVYDVSGRLVTRTTADNIILTPGFYVLRCANISQRLIIK